MATTTRESRQSVAIDAPVEFLYGLIAQVDQMRRIFTPVIHTEYLERGDNADRVERWTWERHMDSVGTWRARRWLDPAGHRISFEHENPAAPLAAVSGEWSFAPQNGGTLVELRHTFTVDNGAEAGEQAAQMLDRGAGMQLGRLKGFAEQYDELAEREVSYEVELTIPADVEDVYGYFYEVDKWAERIPHCLGAQRREPVPHQQVVVMDVQVPSGAIHTTKQARVCFPAKRIMWRQLEGLPPLDEMLYGHMTFTPTEDGVLVRTGQTELLKPAGVAKRGWSMAEAKQHVAEVRGGRNLSALRSAAEYLARRG